MAEKKIIGYLYGDDGKKEPMYLSSKAEKELEEIRKEVDKDFKPLFDELDKLLKKCEGNYTHKDVCGFGRYMYVIKKETGERLYLFETPKRK